MNAPENLPVGAVLKSRSPAAVASTPSLKLESADACDCRPAKPEMKRAAVESDQPTVAETDLWLNYSCAALNGLLARPNSKYTKEQLAVTACEYADLMADGFRKRFA